jgi:Caudovirus prohead protease.
MKLQKQFQTELKAVDESGRRITFVMSSEAVDRDGDIIRQDGWQLENFRKNPVFLVFHDQRQFPIGRVEDLHVETGKLYGTVQFAEKGTYQTADVAYELYRQGIMNAVSVSFAALEYEPLDGGGLDIKASELYELSAVPVPANQEALAVAVKSLDGIIAQPDAQAPIDDSETWTVADLLAEAAKQMGGSYE